MQFDSHRAQTCGWHPHVVPRVLALEIKNNQYLNYLIVSPSRVDNGKSKLIGVLLKTLLVEGLDLNEISCKRQPRMSYLDINTG